MADVTVDEVVDSLVKEIENEMENTISSAKPVLLPPRTQPKFQIPLKEIGNDTMEMIIKYNTGTNGISTMKSGEDDDDVTEEEMFNETNALDLDQEKVTRNVREYTLADYDLSIGSIGTLSTGQQDVLDMEDEDDEEHIEDPSVSETEKQNINDGVNEPQDIPYEEEQVLDEKVEEFNEDGEAGSIVPSLEDKYICDDEKETTATTEHHEASIDTDPEYEVHFQPLSTIGGLGSTKSDIKLALPSNETQLNNNYCVDLNGSFDLPNLVDQEPIIMTTIFEDGASTMTENIPPLAKDGQLSNDYLSIWHYQNNNNNNNKSNGEKITSPALSSHSRFSDGTVTTLVNSQQGQQQLDGPSNNSNFSFKPRLVSRSKVHYPNSNPSSRVSSGEVNAIVIPGGHKPYSRVSSSGRDNIYSNGEYAFMGDVIDNSIDFTKENPLDFTFNNNGDFSKLNSFALLPETSLIKRVTDANLGESPDTSLQNLEESLSTIIDFDKPNVLSNYLEHELGTGFGDFLYSIDQENTKKSQNDNSHVIDLDSLKGKAQSESSSIKDDTILFEQFESGTPVKSIAPRQLVNKYHTQSPIKVIGKLNHKIPIKLTSDDSNQITKPKFVEPFSENSIVENAASLEQSSIVTRESPLVETISIPKAVTVMKTVVNPLPDAGKIYISFGTLSFFDLEGVESHKSKFSVHCKFGDMQLTTPYAALTRKQLEMKQDLTITLTDKFFEQQNNILDILIKCAYEKVKTDLVPVKEKVQVGKKHLFRKTKYVYKTRYVQRSIDTDRWDHLFGPKGEYCTGSYTFSKEEIEKLKFQNKTITISLKNKWAKGLNPYEVTNIRVKVSCISRTSKDEILPENIKVASKILEKYRRQQSISKCGYMIQDGGDLSGTIQRRHFELNGNVLTACHETSHKPQLLINLLNVKTVSGYEVYDEEDKRKFTNFTDRILLNECIQLVFENDEVISFNVEGGEEEKSDWFMKLNEVVQLNVSHQPWVKYLLREEEFQDVPKDNTT